MKYAVIRITVMFLLSGISPLLAQHRSVEAMLRDPAKQKEIFQAIATDTAQMRQFMLYVTQPGKAGKEKHNMSGSVRSRDVILQSLLKDADTRRLLMTSMMEMMEKDSVMCKNMRMQMEQDDHMKGMMHSASGPARKAEKTGMHCPMHAGETGHSNH